MKQPKHIMFFAMPVIIVILTGGCATNAQQNVAFAEESLTAAINLTATALESGAIDVEKAKDLRAQLKQVETYLRSARNLVIEGKVSEGNAKLDIARSILIEVNKILTARQQ